MITPKQLADDNQQELMRADNQSINGSVYASSSYGESTLSCYATFHCPTGSQYIITGLSPMQSNAQEAQADALRQLAESIQQRNFEHIFASILVFDGTKKDNSSEWSEKLEYACLQTDCDIFN